MSEKKYASAKCGHYDEYGSPNWNLSGCAMCALDAAIRERDEARAMLTACETVRNMWCNEYTDARDERESLRSQLDEARTELQALYDTPLAQQWAKAKAERDEARAELAKVKASLTDVQECRDDWCEQYTLARDQRDALRAAIEAHNAECHALPGDALYGPEYYLIPLPPAAAAPEAGPKP